IVLCLPAMGISARFYSRLAETLAHAGLNAAVFELRGLGTSSVRASHDVDFGYTDIVELDLPAAIRAVRERFPGAPLYLLGHSLGGHLAVLYLARNPDAGIGGLALVASGTPWYRIWRPPLGWVLYGVAWLAPLLAKVLGYFPGRLFSFAGRESFGVISDWAHIAHTGNFAPRGWPGTDPEVELGMVDLPILGVSLENDRFTPRPVVEHFLAKFPAARIERFHYDHRAHGAPAVDHVRWPRHPEAIVDRIKAWIGSLS
ncbi:MAG TPA: alpha/beta fold hydrolase, partial [Vulgatibacter sp.]